MVARTPAFCGSGPLMPVRHLSPVPERLAVGAGTALYLDGLCWHPDGPTSDLKVSVEGVEHRVLGAVSPPPGAYEGTHYWWAIIPFEPVETTKHTHLALHTQMSDGGEAVGDLGTVALTPTLEVADAAAAAGGRTLPRVASNRPLIAVCMATWDPPIDLFRRQVESLREQTYDNWTCLISDDRSSPARLDEMRAVLGDDERFVLTQGLGRLGFYGNFERALALVPPESAYVALCDQDDRWYPDKLETLAASLRSGAKLAYSDMRIVDRDGRVASETYWTHRRNNYTDLGSLLMANTVTGAASLFTRELLDYLLPFPPRYRNAYHDHWIALVALALGEIAYVDRPLYDYVQHTDAVLGHARANQFAWGIRLPGAPAAGDDRYAAIRAVLDRLSSREMRRYYFEHYCGASVTAKVIDMRCGRRMAPAKRRTIQRFLDPKRAMAWLVLRSPRRLSGKTETLHREQALLLGLAWRCYAAVRTRVQAAVRRRTDRRAATSHGLQRRALGQAVRAVRTAPVPRRQGRQPPRRSSGEQR